MRTLTVNSSTVFRIPAGALIVTDPVDLTVGPRSELAVDMFVPDDLGTGSSPITMHNGANQTGYVAPGNHVGEAALTGTTITRSWFLLARVEVVGPAGTGAVAAFGDSITDGARSTPDTNNRWPDHLARRLPAGFAVMNVGIAGNRVLSEGNVNAGINALARFDRDVLAQPGVTHVIVMEGINEGAAYFTQAGEAIRMALNQWIRTSGSYDGVIDFEAVVRDPAMPTRIKNEFDSGDHLHPNDAGYKAMGESVNLSLFKAGS